MGGGERNPLALTNKEAAVTRTKRNSDVGVSGTQIKESGPDRIKFPAVTESLIVFFIGFRMISFNSPCVIYLNGWHIGVCAHMVQVRRQYRLQMSIYLKNVTIMMYGYRHFENIKQR
jgi:hypothetical protein